jgi:MoaA/NifB/PqqE/SkfB family radical SAM enzyme
MPELQWVYRRAYEVFNYRLRHWAGGRLASHCRPVSIIFLLTERCNAKCLHCNIWMNRGQENSPTLEQWKTVLNDMRQWLGPVQVTFSGGEALLKPYTIDLVRHAHSLGLNLELLTHGWWEDQTKIESVALAKPWRVTISCDGIGEVHNIVRGKPNFWEKTSRTIETLLRMRQEHKLGYTIRLKNVIMSHNLSDTLKVAEFANRDGMEVFYQPIEQNYNTADNPEWYTESNNWPSDPSLAISNVRQLIEMKRKGFHIANSFAQLEAMVPYFQNPDQLRIATQTHSAHEQRRSCNALITLQFQSNGDVTVCTGVPPVGNVKETPIREIWENRPHFWEQGCCLERRCSEAELTQIDPAASLKAASAWKR